MKLITSKKPLQAYGDKHVIAIDTGKNYSITVNQSKDIYWKISLIDRIKIISLTFRKGHEILWTSFKRSTLVPIG